MAYFTVTHRPNGRQGGYVSRTRVTLNAAHDYACARSAAHGWARVREFDLHGNLIWTATHDR
jgi:hypothetical protein